MFCTRSPYADMPGTCSGAIFHLLPSFPLQVHVLLALEVPGSEPPAFVVHRPATGRSRQTLSLQVGGLTRVAGPGAGTWWLCLCWLPSSQHWRRQTN